MNENPVKNKNVVGKTHLHGSDSHLLVAHLPEVGADFGGQLLQVDAPDGLDGGLVAPRPPDLGPQQFDAAVVGQQRDGRLDARAHRQKRYKSQHLHLS